MPSALAIYSLASMAAVLAIAVEPVLLIRNGEWFSQVRLELPARFIIETARSLSVLHTLVLVNSAYCIFIHVAIAIQHMVFGELRHSERQSMYERLLNIILFKIVCIGALMEPVMLELLLWTSYFSLLGFLRVFSLLCRDRFEYITALPSGSRPDDHKRIVPSLATILFIIPLWCAACVYFCGTQGGGWSLILLLTCECVILCVESAQTLMKLAVHLYDTRNGQGTSAYEHRSLAMYHIELYTDVTVHLLTLAHYWHILLLHGFTLTLIDVVLLLNMRSVFLALRRRIVSHLNFRRANWSIDFAYGDATEEALKANNDDCAICRETMNSAKVLPCGHLFHAGCLRAWLERSRSCPYCRIALGGEESPREAPEERAGGRRGASLAAWGAWWRWLLGQQQQHHRHQRADGRPTPPPPQQAHQDGTGLMDDERARELLLAARVPTVVDMARQVQEIFPTIPREAVLSDLARTGSVARTLENIMDGRRNHYLREETVL